MGFVVLNLIMFPLVEPALACGHKRCVKLSIRSHLEQFSLFCFPPGGDKAAPGAIQFSATTEEKNFGMVRC